MRGFASLLLVLAALATPGFSQSEDRGLLQGFLEDNLSDVGREVRITGFAGALSGRATLEELTIADDAGVWLTLRGAVFDWNRAQLLRGALEIAELSAEAVTLHRAPQSKGGLPQPEATPFALPELPVSIEIGTLAVTRLTLGEALLGEAAAFTLEGAATLAGRAGQAALNVRRIDGAEGSITLEGAFSNATRVLDLTLDLREGPDGIAANVLDLPGRPALRLRVAGTGPIAEYTAEIGLETEGQTRLSGAVTLAEDTEASRFAAELGGDLRPLVKPDYRAFLGREVRLAASGARFPDGRLTLDALSLSTQAMSLTGALAVGADGWPERVDVTGQITPGTAEEVLVSLPGPPTWLSGADLRIRYDQAAGDLWTMALAARGIRQAGIAIAEVDLGGTGRLTPGLEGVTGALTLGLGGIVQSDRGLDAALGRNLRGELGLDWRKGAPLRLRDMDLSGADYRLQGAVDISGVEGQLDLEMALDARLAADRLARFAGLAGVPLDGAATLEIGGQIAPVSGAFDLDLSGTGADLSIGQPLVDPLIGGATALRASVLRNAAGLTLRQLNLSSDAAEVAASGRIASAASEIAFDARLDDVAWLVPDMAGAATLNGTALQNGPEWRISADVAGPGATTGQATATLALEDGVAARVTGDATLRIARLTEYAPLVGLPLAGGVAFEARGAADLVAQSVTVDLDGTGTALAIGQPQVDRLIAGRTELSLRAASAADAVTLRRLEIASDTAEISAEGTLLAEASRLSYAARLADIGVLADGASGVATIVGTAVQTGARWQLVSDVTAPGDTTGRVDASMLLSEGAPGDVRGDLQLSVGDLTDYATLLGRPIAGGLSVGISGAGNAQDGALAAEIRATGTDLRVGQSELDRLLRGESRVALDVTRDAGITRVDRLDLTTPAATAELTGQFSAADASVRYALSLRDVGVFLPEISGPVTGEGTLAAEDGPLGIAATLRGPGGIDASVRGEISRDGRTPRLTISGAAPLGLANRAVAPNLLTGTAGFDLRLDGGFSLAALSGTVRTSGARATLPALRASLDNVSANARLVGGSADLTLDAAVSSGGRLALRGRAGLAAPVPGALSLTLQRVVVADPRLYETTVDGNLMLQGALGGGAALTGALALGPTEIRIPDGAAAGGGAVPGLIHLNEPVAVRQTRVRAGLIESGGSGGVSVAYPLDVTISAPARIFVRGRGLDAELGGALQLQGTTADVVTAGRFDLIRGRLDILGKRLVLNEASALLLGDFDPAIRAVATTTEADAVITITVEGPASAPDVRFSSAPELPEDEILARLLFGRDISQISALQALQMANAVRVLSGQSGEGVVGRLRQNFGLDDLDITTGEDGAAGLRVGRYINENIYTDVTVDTTGQSEINLNLTLSPSVTVRGSASSDGNTGVGIFFERDY